MIDVENVATSAAETQGMGINGGDSAGAPNGSRVAKIDPPQVTHTVFSSRNTQVEVVPAGELSNKQDGNQDLKKAAQRKPVAAGVASSRELMELPPAMPISVRGRPTVLTPDLLDQVCQLVALGFSRAQAAAHLGINRSIITRAAQKDRELQTALQQAEELSDLQPQITVMAEARKNWRAAAWLLEFKAKYHRRIETPEDKEEAHQEVLDEIRRSNERTALLLSGEGVKRDLEPELKPTRGKRSAR